MYASQELYIGTYCLAFLRLLYNEGKVRRTILWIPTASLLEGMDSAGQLCNTVCEEHCNVNECEMDVRRAHFVDRILPRGIKGDLEIMFLVIAFA